MKKFSADELTENELLEDNLSEDDLGEDITGLLNSTSQTLTLTIID